MHILYQTRNYRYGNLCELTRLAHGGWHWYKNFLILTSDIYIPNITSTVIIKNILKLSFQLISSSTNIIQFDNVKFLKIKSSNDGAFKKWVLQKSEFCCLFFQSIIHNNVVSQNNLFSSTFLKLWVHISDSIAGVVGGRSTARGGIGYRR